MKPAPSNWPRMSSAVVYQDAAAAIDWLCEAFGFQVRLKIEGDNGRIEHSELVYGEGLIMVSHADAHCAHARARGATIFAEPQTQDYGKDYWTDRSYGAADPEGHLWWIVERLSNA